MEINCKNCDKVIGNFFFGDDGNIKTGLEPKIFDLDESKSIDMGVSKLFTYVCDCGAVTEHDEIQLILLEVEMARYEQLSIRMDKKTHAIEFAEFITNDTTFEDFCFMSEEQQEKIYELFLKEKEDEN